MNSRYTFAAVAAALCLASPALAENEWHTFTNSQGKTLQAKVLSVENGQVKIQRQDGGVFSLALSTLSAGDQQFVETWRKTAALERPIGSTQSPGLTANAKVTAAQLNEAIGHSVLIDGTPIWQRPADEIAKALKWPQESKTPIQSSYRKYLKAGSDYRFTGAMPYSAALYAEADKPTSFSLVFANKGDFFGSKGAGQDHFDKDEVPPDALPKLRAAMKADAESISNALTKVLGAGERQQFGEGEGRRTVMRWDWLGHAFLLAEEDKEYVGLSVVPSEFADLKGKVARVPDAVMRERIRSNVKRSENGDVVIQNIPMVDQGPKGYCAPATCERAMRYVAVPADMYLLAMAGGTGLGGGTSVERLLEAVGRDIKRKGRSFESLRGPVAVKKIDKFIDAGLPLLWRMYSTDPFNDIANERTKKRSSVTDMKAWIEEITTDPRVGKLGKDDKSSHCTMIIGYNKETNEIAFSDSWGERFTCRWVRAEEADKVSQGAFFVIGL